LSHDAILALEDGTVFKGIAIGAHGIATGEVVFNTAMTGYQEILTDPSYCRQIVTLTCPHIGNTGVNEEDEESLQIEASGLVVRDTPRLMSNWRSHESLPDYLRRQKVVAIADIDTRQLTRLLRTKGALNGCLMAGPEVEIESAVDAARRFAGLKGMDLAQVVTTNQSYEWHEGSWDFKQQGKLPVRPQHGEYHVVAYDFGVKRNILRLLVDRGCRVTVVPAKTSAREALTADPDGIFLSNGPGDPEPCTYAIEAIKSILDKGLPIFGICLGHQLLALACGARTVKMKFGHHGANHPVLDIDRKRVMITSQNHGFAVDEASLPQELRVTHRSLFDGTVQGIEHAQHPAFAFQGHPEASPGPHDAAPLFDRFIKSMAEARV